MVWGERGPRMRDRKARTFGSRWADTRNVVISSNVPLRQDGLPHASRAGKRYDDPRVTVYFSLKSRALSMAQDRYYTPWENIRSLILAINATRSTERHGDSTMMERAFSGFAAIAKPEVVREQFDAFERREWSLGIEERRERAARLKLPVDYPRTIYSPPMATNDSAEAQEFGWL